MAGRKLKDLPPETPFMQSRGAMPDSTPVIKPIQLKAGAPGLRQMNVLGRIDPSKVAGAKQEEAKKPFLAAIPAFKAAALKEEKKTEPVSVFNGPQFGINKDAGVKPSFQNYKFGNI